MKKIVIHEIRNYLQQILSNSESITDEINYTFKQNIQDATYKIEALLTDSTTKKEPIVLNSTELNLENFKSTKVLIVDDMPENIYIMENIFKTLSSTIVSVTSGEKAIEVCQEGFHPQIVCMDMMMPGIDGVTTTKELKKLGLKAYFIAISALKNQSTETVSLFDSWLSKPFTTGQIRETLLDYQLSLLPCEDNDLYTKEEIDIKLPKELQEELLLLTEQKAYSELLNLIFTINDSNFKKVLLEALYKLNFTKIKKYLSLAL